jgi:hypothetical protein
MRYTCPVCGYDQLLYPPTDYNICPSCGTEFGYTDFTRDHAELRMHWIDGGMRWHSSRIPAPPQWNPEQQLIRAGFSSLPPGIRS